MAEKRFDTRILLKYDTLANWNSSTIELKAGEVAIATVPAAEVETKEHGIITPPAAVIIKVGDGKSTFAQLPIVSGLAADVYSWAKKDEGEFKTWLSKPIAEGGAGFATDAELANVDTTLRGLISRIEGGEEGGGLVEAYADIDNLKLVLKSFLSEDGSTAVEDAVKTAIDAVDAKIGARKAGEVAATGIYADIEALEAAVETLESADTSLGNRITANENKLAGIGTEETVKGLIKDVSDEVEAIVEDLSIVETKLADVDEDETVGALIAAAEQAAKDHANSKFSTATSAISGLEERVEANEDAIEVLNGEGEGSVKKQVADAIAAVVADAPEDFDTLKEVAEWIGSDTTGAAQMQTDIADLKTTVSGHTTTIGQHASAITEINGKIGVESSEGVTATGLYADVETLNSGLTALTNKVNGMTGESGVITLLTGRVKANEDAIKALQEKDTTIEGSIKSLQSLVSDNTAAIATEKSRAEAAEATLLQQVTAAQSAANKVAEDLAKEIERATKKEEEIEGAITSLDSSLAAVAKSGKVADLIQGEDEIILDCGNATGKTVIAG